MKLIPDEKLQKKQGPLAGLIVRKNTERGTVFRQGLVKCVYKIPSFYRFSFGQGK